MRSNLLFIHLYKRSAHVRLIALINTLLFLLAGCKGPPPAEQAAVEADIQSKPTSAYHNPYFAAFVLAITNTTQLVQPLPASVPVNHKAARLGKALFMSP